MTAAAQASQIAHLVSGETAGSDVIDMRRLNRYGNMTMDALEAVTSQNRNARLLPYFVGLSASRHCCSVLFRSTLFSSPQIKSHQLCAALYSTALYSLISSEMSSNRPIPTLRPLPMPLNLPPSMMQASICARLMMVLSH